MTDELVMKVTTRWAQRMQRNFFLLSLVSFIQALLVLALCLKVWW